MIDVEGPGSHLVLYCGDLARVLSQRDPSRPRAAAAYRASFAPGGWGPPRSTTRARFRVKRCSPPATFIFTAFALMTGTIASPHTAFAERKWSRSEILAIADKEAARIGYDVEHMSVSFDIYNSVWEEHLKSNENVKILDSQSGEFRPISDREREQQREESLEGLKGHDYWAVYYASLQHQLGGDLFIFIDRGTGKVIKKLGGE